MNGWMVAFQGVDHRGCKGLGRQDVDVEATQRNQGAVADRALGEYRGGAADEQAAQRVGAQVKIAHLAPAACSRVPRCFGY